MSLSDSFEIGKNAINVHGKRLELAALNMANIETPNYVRKVPVVHATDNTSFFGVMNVMKNSVFSAGTFSGTNGGIAITGIVEDPTLGERIYKPGHPDADANGYIRTSNVNPFVEIADATLARRAYEANAAILSITKSMEQRALEIGRS